MAICFTLHQTNCLKPPFFFDRSRPFSFWRVSRRTENPPPTRSSTPSPSIHMLLLAAIKLFLVTSRLVKGTGTEWTQSQFMTQSEAVSISGVRLSEAGQKLKVQRQKGTWSLYLTAGCKRPVPQSCHFSTGCPTTYQTRQFFNPLNTELNPICQ